MHRTNTTTFTVFTLPPPMSADFDFSTPNDIRITIPEASTFRVPCHWHSPDRENCLFLKAEAGSMQVSYHKEPRTGGVKIGQGDYKFQPGYWTEWTQSKQDEKAIMILTVSNEGLQRNVCSAILDAENFPHLTTTPLWLRGLFAAMRMQPAARSWLVDKMRYVQLQAIYYQHECWQYHGGINALRWWQWTHPFDIGQHPAWTVSVQYRSQKVFSKVVQGIYYWTGKLCLGMRGDYPEYNPQYLQNRR